MTGGRQFGRVAAALTVSLAVALAAFLILSSSAGGSTGLGTTGAYWSGLAQTRSVSFKLYVAAVDCGRVRHASYVGQRNGAELFDSATASGGLLRPFDFVGYDSFCHAGRPAYRVGFEISNPSARTLRFRPAGFGASPGDPLVVTLTLHGARVLLAIRNLNTHRSANASGPSLGLSTSWAAGVLPLFAGATGRPLLRGTVPLVQEYSLTGAPNTDPGPAPFAPVVFGAFRVSGTRLTYNRRRIGASAWFGSTGNRVHVTHPSDGAFSAIGRVKPPRLGQTLDATPVTGTSLYESPGGHHFRKLSRGDQIPNGSTIDTTHGQVQLTLSLPNGRSETGVFYAGRFQLHQDRSTGAATATLAGGSNASSVCALSQSGGGAVSIASTPRVLASAAKAKARRKAKPKGKGKPKSKGKKLDSLWANAHGNFTTQGSGGAAAVLGTKWFTENTCAGTYFKVVRDTLRVTVYYPHVHTVVVKQGHSLFAPNEAPEISVSPVSATGGRYNVQLSGYYELTVIGSQQPYYVDAAVAPQLPLGGNDALYPDGQVGGTPRWHIIFHITPNLGNFQDWNVGVRDGGLLYVVKLRVG